MANYKTESLNNMAVEVGGFIEDLEAGIAVKTDLPSGKYKTIILCGMGASAIGGAIYRDSMYYHSNITIEVAKTMALPHWTKEDTLFVACSYSGNTYETVELYHKAMSSGIDTAVVTHGGQLRDLALENGNVLIEIGGGPIQPRSAIGWFVGLIGGLIEDVGCPGIRYQLRKMIPWLRASMENMEREGSYTHQVADRITEGVGPHSRARIPVVYGTPDMDAVAVRLKNQLNENSKLVAFSGVMPEFNHNEIVGWYEDDHRNAFLPIIIRDYMDKDICKLVDSTVEVMQSKGLDPVVVDIKGDTLLERMVYAVMFGDHLSFYVAVNREVDPLNVDPITAIKRTIKSKLER